VSINAGPPPAVALPPLPSPPPVPTLPPPPPLPDVEGSVDSTFEGALHGDGSITPR
jgi:hypothetical protein